MKMLVTGGSSGIGEATVRRLAQGGHEIHFTYQSGVDRASTIAQETGAVKLHYDLASDVSIEALAQAVRKERFDALINNAAPPVERTPLLKTDPEKFIRYLSIGLKGTLIISQAFAQSVRERKTSGIIVNVLTSYTLGMPPEQLSSYIALKHALLGLTRSMAAEFSKYKIRVNAVSPSMTRTAFLSGLPERFIESVEEGLPLGRIAEPEEISGVIQFLLTPESSYIHGANIPVTGGQAC